MSLVRRGSAAELDHFVEAVRDYAILTLGPDGRVRSWNLGAQRIKGYAAEEVVNSHFSIFYTDDDVAAGKPAEILARAASLGSVEENGWRVRKDGSRFWANVVVTALFEDGELAGYTKVTRDMTEHKAFEDELVHARDVAEQANQAKDQFLSTMSHELRTPLNAVLGFSQLLQRDTLTADQRESVDQILKAGRHLLDLINEVLDIARVSSGQLTLSPEPVGVSKLVSDAVALVRPMADLRSIRIVAENGSGLHVRADRQRVKQVLLNLLTNAVKFNRHGGTVRVTWDKAEGDRLRLNVHDEGPGIALELQDRVFLPFDRLGVDDTQVEGTGLGLALSRGLMEMMDGTLSLRSTTGAGSTFTIELPIAEPQLERFEREHIRRVLVAGSVMRIIYIEDNLSNLRLVQRILEERPSIELLPAMQGQIGLDLVRLHQPDLILLDLHLPDMGGEDVLDALQADPATAQVPVVVMSADARPSRIERLRAKGVRDYLSKPIDIEHFLAMLDGFSTRSPQPASSSIRLDPTTARPVVLHIEDDESNRRLMTRLFASTFPDLDLVVASTGADGLHIARDRDIALIMLDGHLPDMSGADVRAALDADERTRVIPVVIVSGEPVPVDEVGSTPLQILKPFVLAELSAAIRGLIEADPSSERSS